MKVGAELKFTISSIFSNSNKALIKQSEEIIFSKAICPDCSATDPTSVWWTLFTLVGPEDEEVIPEQTYTINDLNIFDTI